MAVLSGLSAPHAHLTLTSEKSPLAPSVRRMLGAAQRPFSPRFPLLHMTLTNAQLDDARRRLDDPAIRVVFIDAGRPRFHWSRELIPTLREHVAKSFELDGRSGDLEVWRRKRAR